MIAGRRMRSYRHPHVQPGFPWLSLQDLAAVVGYPPAGCDLVASRWREAHPTMAEHTADGTVIVSDQIGLGFLEWCIDMGLPDGEAIKQAYAYEASVLFLRLTAHLSRPDWQAALQQATLVDHIPMPGSHAN